MTDEPMDTTIDLLHQVIAKFEAAFKTPPEPITTTTTPKESLVEDYVLDHLHAMDGTVARLSDRVKQLEDRLGPPPQMPAPRYYPQVTRVEFISDVGRQFVFSTVKNVRTELQDDACTLKVFLEGAG